MSSKNSNRTPVILILIVLLGLSACASQSSAIKVRDISTATKENRDDEAKVPKRQSFEPEVAKIQPIYQDKAPESLPIVEQLIQQAQFSLDQYQFNQAIEFSERGLRIQRRESRLYLILATAYDGLSDPKQSKNFARQGLLYAVKDSPTARQLNVYAQ